MTETKDLIERLKMIGETESAERMTNLLKSNIELITFIKESEKQLTLLTQECDKSKQN